VEGFLWNAGSWGILCLGMGVLSGPAMWWWGLAVAIHGIGVAVKVLSGPDARPVALPEGTAPAPAPRQVPATADPFLAELDVAIAALGRAAGGKSLPGVDLGALRAAAQELRRRHLALLAIGGADAREQLAREQEEALARAAGATDPRTAEVLRAQAESVSGRLAALDQAAGAAARLEARERTLLHQVEALRVSLLQSGLDEARAPDLAGEVERLRLDLRAETELESDLARARLGGRLGQSS